MRYLRFKEAILFGPLAYAIHHGEEHLLFNFREWRLSYFPDNNGLSTEAIFVLITGVSLVYIISNHLLGTRVAAEMTILFAAMSQIANAFFHIGGTLIFWDFSPGLITGTLLYLPVNAVIMATALREGIVTKQRLALLLALGAGLFGAFELLGPTPLTAFIVGSWAWIAISATRVREPEVGQAGTRQSTPRAI